MDVSPLLSWRSAAGFGLLCALSLTGCVTTIENTAADGTKQVKTYLPWEVPPDTGDIANKKASPGMNLSYARVQEDIGKTSEARALYEKVLRQDPRSSEAMMGIARLDQMAGRSAEAEQHYIRAVNADPGSPKPLAALGNFYAENKRWNDSIRLLNQATQKAPDDKAYRYQMAVALARAGQTREALPHFVQTVGPAEAHYNLAIIMNENGDLAGAEDNLALALTKNPQLEQAQVWLDEVRRKKELQLASSSSGGPFRPAVTNLAGNSSRRPGSTASPAMTGRPSSPNEASRNVTASANRPQGSVGGPSSGVGARNVSYSRNSTRPASRTGNGARPETAATPLPASAGHNPPPGVTDEQWEQWNNQQSNAARNGANNSPN